MSQPKLLATTVLFTAGCLVGSVVAAKDAAMGVMSPTGRFITNMLGHDWSLPIRLTGGDVVVQFVSLVKWPSSPSLTHNSPAK